MDETIMESTTPQVEPEKTEKNPSAEEILAQREAEIADLKKKEMELQAQKEHWREKYERDIAKAMPEPSEVPESDEGRAIKRAVEERISSLQAKLDKLEEEKEVERTLAKYPVLKDKLSEFNEFRSDYPKHKLENVAKIFLAEKDLIQEVLPRKGLEKTVAGPKTPTSSGLSVEDVKNLRENNWEKYINLVRSGQIRTDDIK